jgi:hypothetical protein
MVRINAEAANRYHVQLQAQAEVLWDKWWLVDSINKRADEIMRGESNDLIRN